VSFSSWFSEAIPPFYNAMVALGFIPVRDGVRFPPLSQHLKVSCVNPAGKWLGFRLGLEPSSEYRSGLQDSIILRSCEYKAHRFHLSLAQVPLGILSSERGSAKPTPPHERTSHQGQPFSYCGFYWQLYCHRSHIRHQWRHLYCDREEGCDSLCRFGAVAAYT
jgi:hypothetical protein